MCERQEREHHSLIIQTAESAVNRKGERLFVAPHKKPLRSSALSAVIINLRFICG